MSGLGPCSIEGCGNFAVDSDNRCREHRLLSNASLPEPIEKRLKELEDRVAKMEEGHEACIKEMGENFDKSLEGALNQRDTAVALAEERKRRIERLEQQRAEFREQAFAAQNRLTEVLGERLELSQKVATLEAKLALPPPVCTGTGFVATDWNQWLPTSEGMCGICGRKVPLNCGLLTAHPYVDLKVG